MNRAAATRAGMMLVVGLLLASCRTPTQDAWLYDKNKPKAGPAPAAPIDESAAAPEDASSDATQPAEVGPPDILTRKAETYAQSLQQALEARQQAATTQRITASANREVSVESAPAGQTPAPIAAPAGLEPAPSDEASPAAPAPPQVALVQVAPPVEVSISPASTVRPPRPAHTISDPSWTGLSRPPAAGADGEREMGGLDQRLADRLLQNPRDPSTHLDQQLMAFVRGDQVPNLTSLSPLPSEDRELLTALLDGLSNYRTILRAEPNATTGRKTRPLLDMAERIREQSELTLPVVRACITVRGYGDYDVMDAERMPAAGDLRMVIYCEVSNFASRPDAQHAWETRLTKQVTLLNEADGRRVWSNPAETILDRCRNRRHDFYCTTRVQLPKSLPAGRYVMKVTVTDQAANKVAESSLPVVLVGQ